MTPSNDGKVLSGESVKHTPGPWQWSGVRQTFNGIPGHAIYKPGASAKDEIGIALVYYPTRVDEIRDPSSPSECLANRALIAAAPDLLEALKGLLEHACIADAAPEDVDEEDRARERAARKAITKAGA